MFKANERNRKNRIRYAQREDQSGVKYPHRLNLFVWLSFARLPPISLMADHTSYDRPPLGDVSTEEFETSALDRLRVLAEIESSVIRNRQWDELKTITEEQCRKYLPLHSNTASTLDREAERWKDHLGHFVLRLAFCVSCVALCLGFRTLTDTREELRRRFLKAESILFRVRYESDDYNEREEFLESRNFDWIAVCLSASSSQS